MAEPSWLTEPSTVKLGASVLGSLVSLKFLVGSWTERVLMFVGGAGLSYFSTDITVRWLGGDPDLLGMVGFFLGLLGMTVVAKAYEVFAAMDAKQISSDMWAWVVRKWGA